MTSIFWYALVSALMFFYVGRTTMKDWQRIKTGDLLMTGLVCIAMVIWAMVIMGCILYGKA